MDNFVDQIGGSKDLFTWQLEDIVFLQDWFYRRSLPTVEQPIFFEIFRQAPYPVRAADHDCWMFHANGGILATLYEQYGEQLLQQNIRVFEGSKATNASIKAACTTDDAANFFHFNNGVTFLCETAVWDAFTSKLTIHRAQIVNGGQTVRVLHDAYKGDTLRPEVYVPVRVITSQGDKEFGNNVAVNLNNQNKVDDSFLKSNHPRVIQLSHSLASRGWYLERRENEIQYMADAERSAVEQRLGGKLDGRIIRIREGTQAYAATYIRAPELAKKNPRRLFMSTSDGGSFERIYNEELSADKFVAAHRIKTYVDEFVNQFVKIKRKKQDAADRKRDYRDYVGEELSEYQTDVDQSLPQSAIFLAAIIFEEHIRIRKKDQDTLLKDLETNARSILSGKIQQILTFARENPTVANKSWPTLLKSQAFFDQFVSYLRGVVSQETKAG